MFYFNPLYSACFLFVCLFVKTIIISIIIIILLHKSYSAENVFRICVLWSCVILRWDFPDWELPDTLRFTFHFCKTNLMLRRAARMFWSTLYRLKYEHEECFKYCCSMVGKFISTCFFTVSAVELYERVV